MHVQKDPGLCLYCTEEIPLESGLEVQGSVKQSFLEKQVLVEGTFCDLGCLAFWLAVQLAKLEE